MTTKNEDETFKLEASKDSDLDGYDVFVVEIEPAYARYLLKQMDVVKTLRRQNDLMYRLELWDYHGDWFDRNWDVVEPEDEVVEPKGEALRTECNRLVVLVLYSEAHERRVPERICDARPTASDRRPRRVVA